MRPLPPNLRFRHLLLLALTACASKSGTPEDAKPEGTPAEDPAPADGEVDADAPDAPPAQPGEGLPDDSLSANTHYTECTEAQYLPGKGATAATPVDGLAIRSRFEKGRAPMDPPLMEAQPLCASAASAEACKTKAAATEKGSIRSRGTQMGLLVQDLIWSRGEEVGAVGSVEDLVAFLGPIETAGDVQLLAWAAGYEVACDKEPVRSEAGWLVPAVKMVSDCPVTSNAYDLRVGSDGAVTVAKEYPGTPSEVCIGRLPAGHECADAAPGLGGWLARVAHLEAAAVLAFDHLVAELVHHGAPEVLVSAARHAREDEVRHAAIFAELARANGGLVAPVGPAPSGVRALLEIAVDNAREGLVRERYGAAVGLWQGRNAHTSELRAAFTEVALDEIRHAELSIALDAWFRSQLSDAERAQLTAAHEQAIVSLSPTTPSDPAVAAAVGQPEPAIAQRLFAAVATAPGSVGSAHAEGPATPA